MFLSGVTAARVPTYARDPLIAEATQRCARVIGLIAADDEGDRLTLDYVREALRRLARLLDSSSVAHLNAAIQVSSPRRIASSKPGDDQADSAWTDYLEKLVRAIIDLLSRYEIAIGKSGRGGIRSNKKKRREIEAIDADLNRTAQRIELYEESASRRFELEQANSPQRRNVSFALQEEIEKEREREKEKRIPLIELLITDEQGRAFWTKHFGAEKHMVEWEDFLAAMKTLLVQSDVSIERALQYILDNCGVGVVTQYKFAEFLKGFGPLQNCLNNVKSVLTATWFHGFLSSEETERMLWKQKPGVYLVRFSRSNPGAFALAYVDSGGVKHSIITRDERGYSSTGSPPFETLQLFINHYSNLLCIPFSTTLTRDSAFHGELSSDEAAELLKSKPEGTYLFRFSTQSGFIAVTFIREGGIKHALIECSERGFMLQLSDRREFTTLVQLAAANEDILIHPLHNQTCDVGSFIDDLFNANAAARRPKAEIDHAPAADSDPSEERLLLTASSTAEVEDLLDDIFGDSKPKSSSKKKKRPVASSAEVVYARIEDPKNFLVASDGKGKVKQELRSSETYSVMEEADKPATPTLHTPSKIATIQPRAIPNSSSYTVSEDDDDGFIMPDASPVIPTTRPVTTRQRAAPPTYSPQVPRAIPAASSYTTDEDDDDDGFIRPDSPLTPLQSYMPMKKAGPLSPRQQQDKGKDREQAPRKIPASSGYGTYGADSDDGFILPDSPITSQRTSSANNNSNNAGQQSPGQQQKGKEREKISAMSPESPRRHVATDEGLAFAHTAYRCMLPLHEAITNPVNVAQQQPQQQPQQPPQQQSPPQTQQDNWKPRQPRALGLHRSSPLQQHAVTKQGV